MRGRNLNRFDWIKESRVGIDARDVSALMGLDKMRNVLDVYIEKTEKVKKMTMLEDALYFEIKLEELVAREFSLRTGKVVRKDLRQQCDKDYKFMITNIDRKIGGENAVLECKVIKNNEDSDFEE